MTIIPFTKFHGAENDFLLTWKPDVPGTDLSHIARLICARHTGIGADGWMLVERQPAGLRTQLFNSDGSEPELSGNGTRCAAAFALMHGVVDPPDVAIETAAGVKHLRLIEREGNAYLFEMNFGTPTMQQLYAHLNLVGRSFDVSILDVGNPQCVIFEPGLPADWLSAAAEAEGHSMFPQRSNVSFVQVLDPHTLQVHFYERGAGQTRSSGTGSTGAAAAAILRGVAESPVEIKTSAGTMSVRWEESVFLTGPAQVIGEGRFLLEY